MALRRPPTTFSDQITDADIGADSIGTSELKDDAVETANIKDSTGASDGITAAKIATNAVTTIKVADDAVTYAKLQNLATANRVLGATGAGVIGEVQIANAMVADGAVTGAKIAADTIEVKPHIVPGLLYPAIAGKGIDGTTTITSWGTDVAISGYPTLKYYYTDIKGSKPIKDPRIGAHFGSQQHRVKSRQYLKDESAAQGTDVYSLDGREWMRVSGNESYFEYGNRGLCLKLQKTTSDTNFIEITGYFSAANYDRYTDADNRYTRCSLNGGTVNETDHNPVIGSILYGKFWDSGSILKLTPNSTPALGINTITIHNKASDESNIHGIELIAQDVADATRRNHVSIPAQNVIAGGKKYSIGSNTLTNAVHKHYNPFAFKTDGSTAWAAAAHNGTSWPVGTGSSHNIDTGTSLGLSAWLHSSNYYKPYNGGRVVVWVANDGTIKTSVNVMPPNARSIGNSSTVDGTISAANAKANASIANNTFYPTMEAGAIDQSQSEIAKTFYGREFGAGAGNQGANGSQADFSMVYATNDHVAHIMDDGLTCSTGQHMNQQIGDRAMYANGNPSSWWYTFIGTGISLHAGEAGTHASADDHKFYVDGVQVYRRTAGSNPNFPYGSQTYAQNLPYGTHSVRIERVTANSKAFILSQVSFHQPKRPPIPEDACVIADYMLMAESLPDTVGAAFRGSMSKGVRRIAPMNSGIFYKASAAFSNAQDATNGMLHGWQVNRPDSDTTQEVSIVAFGTNAHCRQYDAPGRVRTYKQNGVTATTTRAGAGYDAISYAADTSLLQNQKFEMGGARIGGNGNAPHYFGWEIVTPTHTSSHYQPFETPYAHQLVGGDRNMEQTNLVVTGDGKTWDQVTRDTSYIGDMVLRCSSDTTHSGSGSSNRIPFDDWRGTISGMAMFSKHFAIGYDQYICLTTGQYLFNVTTLNPSGNYAIRIYVNENEKFKSHAPAAAANTTVSVSFALHLDRGDFFSIRSTWHADRTHSQFNIVKLS